MTADVELLPLYAELQGHPKLEIVKHYARANVAHATAAKDAEIEALRAEVERLSQLVNGGKGPLPAGAVAWLDMGLQEASLMFDKKTDSNRASKRRARELFQRVSSGHYPLYLEPQADRAERLAEALRECVENREGLAYESELLARIDALLNPTAAQEGE